MHGHVHRDLVGLASFQCLIHAAVSDVPDVLLSGLWAISCMCAAQGMIIAEMWLDQVARTVNKPIEAVRELNLYKEGDITHYTQVLTSSQASAYGGLPHRFSAAKKWPANGATRVQIDWLPAASCLHNPAMSTVQTEFLPMQKCPTLSDVDRRMVAQDQAKTGHAAAHACQMLASDYAVA